MIYKKLALYTLSCIVFLISRSAPTCAQDQGEYTLKTAFLYNFIQFTEWPSSVGNTIKVCVYGGDPFGESLNSLKGKSAGERSISIQRVLNQPELKDCHVVFVNQATIGQLPEISEILKGRPVLIVADSPGAAKRGAALCMETVQNRITFEANLTEARNAGLNLSSKLLQLARKVYQ
jgi:hypothetical protein